MVAVAVRRIRTSAASATAGFVRHARGASLQSLQLSRPLSHVSRGGAGRSCPIAYRYGVEAIAAAPVAKEAETLYVVGGLYGNAAALEAVLRRAEEEEGEAPLIVFNGDFNFFNSDPQEWLAINEAVRLHHAILGNVEYEAARIGGASSDGTCGCAYPGYVRDEVVARSNEIVEQLRRTADNGPRWVTEWLSALEMFMKVRVGPLTVGVLHGDAEALAGWGFAAEMVEPLDTALREDLGVRPYGDNPVEEATSRATISRFLSRADCDVFCCTHTCLPFAQAFQVGEQTSVPATGFVFNNGAAGLPNFDGACGRGVVTRISSSAGGADSVPSGALYGASYGDVRLDAIEIDYGEAWVRDTFLRSHPEGSAAHESYYERAARGVRFFRPEQAAREGIGLHL